jgi:uncharacterized membrane protein YkvA (DUF1232 family)
VEGHDDFYKRLRDRITTWADRNEIKPSYREYLLALPDLFHLVAMLALDKRVDAVSKTLLGVALAYMVSPFDLLPDFLGPIGFIDDLLVVALVVETVLLRVPRKIVNEHWAGAGDILQLVQSVRLAADNWIGRGMYLRIRKYLSDRGIGNDIGKPAKPKAAANAAKPSAAANAARPKAAAKPATSRAAAKRAKPTARRTASKPPAAKAATKAPARKPTAKRTGGSKR